MKVIETDIKHNHMTVWKICALFNMVDCLTRGLLIALALAVAAVRTGKQAHPCMFIRLSLSCGNQKISHRHQKDVGMTLADTAHPPVLRFQHQQQMYPIILHKQTCFGESEFH